MCARVIIGIWLKVVYVFCRSERNEDIIGMALHKNKITIVFIFFLKIFVAVNL